MPALNYATPRGHYLALHEYGAERMDTNFLDQAGRHRQVYSQYGLTIPLIITETGIDSNGDPNTGGWRAHTNATDYFNQLKWYDAELQNDSYVKGAIIFSYGFYNWGAF